jgi:hypothetical protein
MPVTPIVQLPGKDNGARIFVCRDGQDAARMRENNPLVEFLQAFVLRSQHAAAIGAIISRNCSRISGSAHEESVARNVTEDVHLGRSVESSRAQCQR